MATKVGLLEVPDSNIGMMAWGAIHKETCSAPALQKRLKIVVHGAQIPVLLIRHESSKGIGHEIFTANHLMQ